MTLLNNFIHEANAQVTDGITYTCTMAADTTNQTADVRVTGAAATTVYWSGSIDRQFER